MQYLALIILTCALAVSAMPFGPGRPFIGIPYGPPVPGVNSISTGGNYIDQGFSGGSSGTNGVNFQRQGSNMFYNQGQNHSRTKQIVESESSSSHNVGGSSQDSLAGQSGGSFNMFGTGHLNTGGGFYNYIPRFFK